MTASPVTVSPLRQRMLDDMRMRKLEPKTQAGYIRAVRRLAGFLRRPPDTATFEDLRRFQLQMVDEGTSAVSVNATLTGLKFFVEVTVDRGDLMAKVQPARVPLTLPVVLSREEVREEDIESACNFRHEADCAEFAENGLYGQAGRHPQ